MAKGTFQFNSRRSGETNGMLRFRSCSWSSQTPRRTSKRQIIYLDLPWCFKRMDFVWVLILRSLFCSFPFDYTLMVTVRRSLVACFASQAFSVVVTLAVRHVSPQTFDCPPITRGEIIMQVSQAFSQPSPLNSSRSILKLSQVSQDFHLNSREFKVPPSIWKDFPPKIKDFSPKLKVSEIPLCFLPQ